MKKKKDKPAEKFFEYVNKAFPDPKGVGHAARRPLGGDLYFIYIPPNADLFRAALKEKFRGLYLDELIDEIVSKIQVKKESFDKNDMSHLISRAIRKLGDEFLEEIEAEFLAPLYQASEPLLEMNKNTENRADIRRTLNATWPLLTNEVDYSKYNPNRPRVTVRRRLVNGVYTKETKARPGRKPNRFEFLNQLKSVVEHLEAENLKVTEENVVAEWPKPIGGMSGLQKLLKTHVESKDNQRFKKALKMIKANKANT